MQQGASDWMRGIGFDPVHLYHCSLDIVRTQLDLGVKQRPKLSNAQSVSDVDVISVYLLVVSLYNVGKSALNRLLCGPTPHHTHRCA